MRRLGVLAVVSGFLSLLLFPTLAPGQTGQAVGVVTTITGQATVARTALPEPQPLKFKDSVFERDHISTAENSIVRVLLGGRALVTVRELSVLTITEELGRSTVDLQSGKIALGVVRKRMRPGESIEVRTPNAVAAVRGTVLVVEVIRASAQATGGSTAPTTNIHVLKGSAEVCPAGAACTLPVIVADMQTYSQTGNILGSIRPLTPAGASQLLADLQASPQVGQGSGAVTDQIASQEQGRAASALALTTPAELGGGLPGGGNNAPPQIQQPPIIPLVPPAPPVLRKSTAGPPPPPPPPSRCDTSACRKTREQ